MLKHKQDTPAAAGSAVNYTYDAFISYRHDPIDSAAAAALQKNLEHFHAPHSSGSIFSALPFPGKDEKDIKGGKDGKETRIRRVFLDKEEMTAGSSLSLALQEALRQSEWLIVICSPAAKNSFWVDLEIRTFLKTHDRHRILTVLTQGEPADSIPEILDNTDTPLDDVKAADARGRTVREVLKKLRGPALLEIAAPILGTSLYELTQRHRVYRLKRITAAALFCLAAVSVFLLYAFSQNRILEKTNRELQLRQAEVVTQQASELLAEGDNLQAVRDLLSVLPDSSRADAEANHVLADTQYKLTRALNLYQPSLVPNYGDERLAACAVIRNNEDLDSDLLSDETASYLLASADNKVLVWDAETSRPVSEIAFPEYIRNWSEKLLMSGNRILLCGNHTVACYNYVTGEQLWENTIINEICAVCVPGNAAAQTSGNTRGQEDSCLYILTKAGISILQTKDGTILSNQKYRLVSPDESAAGSSVQTIAEPAADAQNDENEQQVGDPVQAVLTSSGKYLVFSSSRYNGRIYYYVCRPDTGETIQIDSQEYDFSRDFICACPDGKTDYVYCSAYYINDAEEYIYRLRAFSLQSADAASPKAMSAEEKAEEDEKTGADSSSSTIRFREEWTNDYPRSSVLAMEDDTLFSISTSQGHVLVRTGHTGESDSPVLYFGCFSRLYFLDPYDGHMLHGTALPASLTGLSAGEDCCYASTSQGNLYTYDGNTLKRLTDVFPSGCNDIEQIGDSPVFYCLQDNRRIVRYAPIIQDNNYTSLTESAEFDFPLPVFQNQKWLVWKNIYDGIWRASEQDNTLLFTSFKEITRAVSFLGPEYADFGEEDFSDSPIPIALEDDDLHLITAANRINDEGTHQIICFHQTLDLSNGNVTADPLFILNDHYSLPGIHFDLNSFTLHLQDIYYDYVILWSCDLHSKKLSYNIVPLTGIESTYLSPDGKKILLFSSTQLKLYILRLDSCKTEAVISLSGYVRDSIDEINPYPPGTGLCWDGETLAIADYMKIHVYNSAGTEIHTIPCGNSTPDYDDYVYPCMALSPDGDTLYYYQAGKLCRYSLSEGKTVNEIVLTSDPKVLSVYRGGALFWFKAGGSEIRNTGTVPDTLYFLHDKNLYIMRCADRSLGLIAQVENVSGYNALTNKIYISRLNSDTSQYESISYKEYTLSDIIEAAEEMYPDEDLPGTAERTQSYAGSN